MMLCWNAEKHSPIHDHPCRGCWMRVVEGAVREERFELGEGESMARLAESTAESPSVVYIDDSLGLHRVSSVGGKRAITLHLYSPPFQRCRVWCDEAHPERFLRPIVTH